MRGIGIIIVLCVIGLLSYGTYHYAEPYKVNEFVITEKNKESLQFVYVENNLHKTLTVDKEDFIKYDVGATYAITKYPAKFYVCVILLVIFIIILMVMIGAGDSVIDLGDILEIFV